MTPILAHLGHGPHIHPDVLIVVVVTALIVAWRWRSQKTTKQ